MPVCWYQVTLLRNTSAAGHHLTGHAFAVLRSLVLGTRFNPSQKVKIRVGAFRVPRTFERCMDDHVRAQRRVYRRDSKYSGTEVPEQVKQEEFIPERGARSVFQNVFFFALKKKEIYVNQTTAFCKPCRRKRERFASSRRQQTHPEYQD